MSIYTDAINKLIEKEEPKHRSSEHWWTPIGYYNDGYLAGLYEALSVVMQAEDELQHRLPAIYEEYGVPLT